MDENSSAPGPDPIPSASSGGLPPPQPEGLPPKGAPFFPPSPAIPSTRDDRLWATVIHLIAILGLSFNFYFIPGHVLLPLVVWLIKREGSPFLNDQGKECLNFQITITLALAASFALMFVCVGFVTTPLLVLYAMVMGIVAAVKANEGTAFRYPLTIRLIS